MDDGAATTVEGLPPALAVAPHEAPAVVHSSRRPAPQTLAVGAVLVLQVLAYLTLSRDDDYWYDDLLHFAEVKSGTLGASPHDLMQPVFGHMVPGHRLVNYLLQTHAPAQFGWARALSIAAVVGTTACVWSILRRLGGPRWSLVAVTAFFAASLVPLSSFLWWAASLHQIVSGFFTVLALERSVAWHQRRGRRWPWLLVALLAWTAALCFYEKPVLAPLYLALAAGFVLAPGAPTPRAAARALRPWLPLLAGYLVIALGWYLLYSRGDYGSISGKPTIRQVVGFLQVSWTDTFWPAVTGQKAQMGGVGGTPARVVVGQLLFAALVLGTCWRAPRAWRVWVTFVFCYALNVTAVGYGRAAWGPGLGHNLLYAVENGWLLALSTGLALTLPRRPGPLLPRVPAGRLIAPAAVVVVLAAWCVPAWSAARATVAVWPGVQVHAYVGNAQASAARITGPYSIWDTPAPFVQPDYPQFSRQRYVLGLGFLDAAVDDPSLPAYLVLGDGHLAPARFAPAASWQASSPTDLCSDGSRRVLLTLPLPARLPTTSDFLQLTTTTRTATTVHVSVGVAGGTTPPASDESPDTALARGRSTTIVPLRPGAKGRLVVDVPAGSAVCLLGAQVGQPVPAGPALG